jgi:hypothetical protein
MRCIICKGAPTVDRLFERWISGQELALTVRCGVQCAVQCAVQCSAVQCVVCSVQCALCTVQYSVQCALYNPHTDTACTQPDWHLHSVSEAAGGGTGLGVLTGIFLSYRTTFS